MNSDLLHAFNFTEDDLVYNRRGTLSPRQAARYKSNNRIGAIVMIILLIPSAVATFYIWWPILFGEKALLEDLWRLFGGSILTFVTLLLFLNLIKFLLRKKDPVVTKIEGKVGGVISREERDHEGDKVIIHYVVIDGQEIQIQKRQASVFREGHTYAMYRNAVLGNLAVEQRGGPPEA